MKNKIEEMTCDRPSCGSSLRRVSNLKSTPFGTTELEKFTTYADYKKKKQ